jgi:predicted DNA-binding transcriptional regulator YafY
MQCGQVLSAEFARLAESMDTAERLLKLLGLLEGRIDWTADELARRLEVTPRTIRRDVTRLRDLGYPVEAVAGPGGGYRLGAGGKMPPLLLDDEEALAMALGLRVSATSAVGGLEDASVSAMAKLEHVLPARLRGRLEDISDATTSTLGSSRSEVDHGTLATVASTIRKGERLRLSYVDNQRRESERHVEPVRLVHTGRRWYLVAFDLDRDDWRTFRLDRVSSPKPTGMRARSRRGPDPVELVQRGITVDSWRFRATLVLHVSKLVAEREIAPTVGTLEHVDETTSRLVIGADEIDWLVRYLLGLSFQFDVEEPQELRDALAETGAALVDRFSA